MTTQHSPDPTAWAPTGLSPTGPRHQAPAPRSRRHALFVLLGVVTVGIVVVGGLVGWRLSPSSQFRFDGLPVEAPGAALSSAEAGVFRATSTHPVNQGRDDRCYFAVADGGTDISQGIYCGPLALTDSVAGTNFLHFEVTGTQHGGHERISVVPDPDQGGTQPLPIGYSLMRPGDSTRRRHFDVVADPLPTAAAADTIVTTAAVGTGQSRFRGVGSPILVGRTGAVAVEELETIPYFGADASERSAAPGQQLIAFKLVLHAFTTTTLDALDLAVTVNGGSPRPLPKLSDDGQWVVVSVPTSASRVELGLPGDSGRQTVSLLDGALGFNGVQVYRRANYLQLLNRDVVMPARFGYSDGSSESTTLRFAFKQARLVYLVRTTSDTEVHPSDPATAWLHIDMSYTDDGRPGKTYSELGSPLQELRLPNGRILQATNVATGAGDFYAYTVPAGFTAGTLILGGGVRQFADGSAETFSRRIEIPLRIPNS